MIMQSWNWVVDALNDTSIDVTSENNLMYRTRFGQIPKLKERSKK